MNTQEDSEIPETSASSNRGNFLTVTIIGLVAILAVGYGCYLYIFDNIRPAGGAGNRIMEVNEEMLSQIDEGP